MNFKNQRKLITLKWILQLIFCRTGLLKDFSYYRRYFHRLDALNKTIDDPGSRKAKALFHLTQVGLRMGYTLCLVHSMLDQCLPDWVKLCTASVMTSNHKPIWSLFLTGFLMVSARCNQIYRDSHGASIVHAVRTMLIRSKVEQQLSDSQMEAIFFTDPHPIASRIDQSVERLRLRAPKLAVTLVVNLFQPLYITCALFYLSGQRVFLEHFSSNWHYYSGTVSGVLTLLANQITFHFLCAMFIIGCDCQSRLAITGCLSSWFGYLILAQADETVQRWFGPRSGRRAWPGARSQLRRLSTLFHHLCFGIHLIDSVTKVYGRTLFAFMLFNLPLNAVLVIALATGRVPVTPENGSMVTVAGIFIVFQFVFLFLVHAFMAWVPVRLHHSTEVLFRVRVFDPSLVTQLKLDHWVGQFHAHQVRYTVGYGRFGAITYQSLGKSLFVYGKFLIFAHKVISSLVIYH